MAIIEYRLRDADPSGYQHEKRFLDSRPVHPGPWCGTFGAMYTPTLFAEDQLEVLYAFIRQHPLAALISCSSEGLEATHIPVVLHTDAGSQGLLRCHLARANSQWKSLQSSASVLVIFQGPEHYITPSWYASMKEHGKVVPTWNYVAVHVRGRPRLLDGGDLIEHLKTLTAQHEQTFDEPWTVEDAPQNYIEALSKTIVGIEIAIDAIEGKWKASQNRPKLDRAGVVSGLSAIDSPASGEMARIVKEREPE